MDCEKIPVTEKTLFQRIRLKLEKESKRLYKSRNALQKKFFGTQFITNNANTLIESNIEDLEALARELNVISGHEYLSTGGIE